MERNGTDAETEALWESSLDGGHDEEVGDTEEQGLWGALFIASKKGELSTIYPTLKDAAGAILTQSSSGIKESYVCTTKSSLDKAWKELEEELAVDGDE